MRVCLIGSGAGEAEPAVARLALLLGSRHEVTVIHGGPSPRRRPAPIGPPVREIFAEPSAELTETVFAGEHHRRSAAVLEAIEGAYGPPGPDYVEAPDLGAPALVPLMARRCGHPLLGETLFGVRIAGSAELSGLHDGIPEQTETRLLGDLEREQLRRADRLLWSGGDSLDLYRRYYPFALPEAARIGLPFDDPGGSPGPPAAAAGGPLRILFAGPLRGGGGALDLAEACLRLPVEEWRLTMFGADTQTAPGGQSVRLTIEAMFGDDPRLEIDEPRPGRDSLPPASEHDLVVVPPTFAVWPEVALAAMRAGLPILATPVGGLTEMVEPGRTGWLADDVGPAAIRRALLRLIEEREEIERVRASGHVFERFRRLTDPRSVLEGYERMLAGRPSGAPRAPRRRSGEEPPVTGIVPYYRLSDHVEEAVDSLLAQTHRNLDVVIVNDGSFEPADDVLLRLAGDPRVSVVTQLNSAETVARNLGICLARGEYVALLDPDNVLEPDFVSRAVGLFEREPELAYVSCWLRFIGLDGLAFSGSVGCAYLGNSIVRDDTDNWDGDTLAVMPRRVFAELGYRYEPRGAIAADWELYRWLREDGRFGAIIPERLARYRVLPGSLQRAHSVELQRYGWDEARGRRALRATRWTAEE